MFASIRLRASAVKERLSAFTGRADFYETLFLIEDVMVKLEPLKGGGIATNPNWLDRESMSNKLGFAITQLQYDRLREKLGKLAAQGGDLPEVKSFLSTFMPALTANEGRALVEKVDSYRNFSRIDELGRVIGIGHRKSCSAKVYLVPGDGQFMVNGKPMTEAFGHLVDRFRAALPLMAAGRLGRHNVWALAQGGGTTGQSGAISLGLARALARAHPNTVAPLNQAGLLTRDLREVERKKPGQPKARKKFTWVKR